MAAADTWSAAPAAAVLPLVQRLCFAHGSSGGGGKFGATALAARMVFDELTLELFIWGNAMLYYCLHLTKNHKVF